MKRIKIIALTLCLLLVSLFTFVGVANAQSIKAGDTINVAVGETINSILFAGGNNVDIAGTVNGDIYCAGQTVNISGTVNGDVFCAGQTVTVSGTVNGSVRLAGQSITLSGTISNSATIGTQSLTIDKSGVIGRDLLGGSKTATINGTVTRDLTMGTATLAVNGTIGRDINGQIDTLNVGSAGSIAGSVNYTGTNDPSISSGGKIIGAVTRTEPKVDQQVQISPEAAIGMAISSFAFIFISSIIFALVIAAMFPKILEDSAAETIKSPVKTVLTGLVAMVVAPISIIALFMTMVGATVGVFVMLAWFIAILISGSFAGYLLGKIIMRKSKKPLLIMLVGVGITTVAFLIPVLNFIVFIAAGLFGTGAILIQSKKLFTRPKF